MKIIKEGVIPKTCRRFICNNCGCIFECDEGEYEVHFCQREGDWCVSNCPTCGNECCSPNYYR